MPAFSPSGDRFVTSSRPSGNPFGASLLVTTVATGQSQPLYQDKTEMCSPGSGHHKATRSSLRYGAFGAFFQSFHELFLKLGDRVDGGAQIAIINPDGTGFRELTSGSGTVRSRRSPRMAIASFIAHSRRMSMVCASWTSRQKVSRP